jgi:hypothetical protein
MLLIELYLASVPPKIHIHLLLGLKVVEEDGALLWLLTPVLDDDAGAVDDLASVAFTVEDAYSVDVSNYFTTNLQWRETEQVACPRDMASHPPIREDSHPLHSILQFSKNTRVALTKSSPLSQLFPIRNLDERNLVLATQRHHQLLVRLLLAALVQNTHVSLAAVKSLRCLTQTAGKSIVDKSELENSLEGIEDAHLALGGSGVGTDFDFVGGCDIGGGLFSVRL